MFREYMLGADRRIWNLPILCSGRVMLCVYPQGDIEPLHAVKWHPQQPDLVAVASVNNVYFLNITDAALAFGGEPISQSDLSRIGQVFSVPSVRRRLIYGHTPCLTHPTSAYHRLRLRSPSICACDDLRGLDAHDVEHSR